MPKGAYRLGSATVAMTIARGRSLAIESAKTKLSSHGNSTVAVTRIPESGWLRSLTRGSRYVRVDYDDDNLEETPLVRFTPAPDSTRDAFNRRMGRLYGASSVSAEIDIPIPAAH